MAGVDLSLYRFDYDLTFAALLMNADGTIYHTYAGRDSRGASTHLDPETLARVLRETLADHAMYAESPSPPKRAATRTIEQMPPMAKRIENGKAPKCFHCHMVNDMETEHARDRRRFRLADLWRWPDPIQVGLTLDDQTRIGAVAPDSAAAKAKLAAGDRILEIEGRRARTFGDVQRALHEADAGRTKLELVVERDGERVETTLSLASGWKEPTPETFAWRPSKWPLSPKPGFGGPPLSREEKVKMGLDPDAFAFRIRYIVTWGPNAHTGRNARAAGLRKGDVIISVAGRSDFTGMDHFHAWFRLTRKVGERVPIVRIRGGKRETVRLEAVE